MDLCVLDEGSLHFPYSIIAASILYHFGSESITEAASSYSFSDIERCVNWLAPFAVTVREMTQPVVIRAFDDVMPEDYHNIQTHDVTVPLLVSHPPLCSLYAVDVQSVWRTHCWSCDMNLEFLKKYFYIHCNYRTLLKMFLS